jgi:hypothetical protein
LQIVGIFRDPFISFAHSWSPTVDLTDVSGLVSDPKAVLTRAKEIFPPCVCLCGFRHVLIAARPASNACTEAIFPQNYEDEDRPCHRFRPLSCAVSWRRGSAARPR